MKTIVISGFCSFRQDIITISMTRLSEVYTPKYNSTIFTQNVSDKAINIENMLGRTFRALNCIYFKCGRIFQFLSPQKSNGLSYMVLLALVTVKYANLNNNTLCRK